jgi:RHS repeat-associated protein
MVFDQSGTLANVKRHDYLPFGEELFAGIGGRTVAQGYAADGVRQQFTSKERDIETGLDYFGARYYSPIQGRFTSTDPLYLELRRLGDPQQLNLYTYTRNNPLKFIDPTGLDVTVTGTSPDDYIAGLQQNVSFKIRRNSQTNKVEIVDSQGNIIDKKGLKALGKTLKGKEKELFNAITDEKNHVTIETVQSDPDVDFGRSDGGGKNTIDFADLVHLDAPKNAGGVTSAHAVGHETLEAYASSKGKNFNDAHKFANQYFGGFGEGTVVQRYIGPAGLLGVTIELPVQGTNIRELVTRQFVTPIPRNTLVTERIPGHIVDVEKKP